jgi:hypothetical protein
VVGGLLELLDELFEAALLVGGERAAQDARQRHLFEGLEEK